jgi:hypothetical protein
MHTIFFVGKPDGKGTHRRPRRMKEYNIRMDLREIGWQYKGV